MRPSASVVICTRNRAASLARTLDSLRLLAVDEPDRFEVVVVDNGSADSTPAVVRAFAGQANFRVTCRLEPEPGLSHARNAGIAAARGEVILFTDDDCIVQPDWLQAAVRAFDGNLLQVVGGRVDLFNPDHLDVSTRACTARERLASASNVFGFVIGANMAFGKPVIDMIGPFDQRLGAGTRSHAAEETDFIYRAFANGLPVICDPSLVVRHDHGRFGREAYFRLLRGYALGEGAMAVKHVLRGRPDLCKPVFWHIVSAYTEWRAGRGSGRAVAVRAASLLGAARFLLLESWRRAA